MKRFSLLANCLSMFAVAVLLAACGSDRRPDTVYISGKIYTGNPEQPVVEAVGTIDSRIVYVGDADGIVGDTRPTTKLIDLTGHVMYPGFINTRAGALIEGVDDEAGTQLEASAIQYAKQGWTTIHAHDVHPDNVRIMEDLAMRGNLPVRVYNILNESGFESLSTYGPGVSPGGLVETRAVLFDLSKPPSKFASTEEVPTLDSVLELALKNHVQLIIKGEGEELAAFLGKAESAMTDALPDADPRWALLNEGNLTSDMEAKSLSLGIEVKKVEQLVQVSSAMGGKLENVTTLPANAGFRENQIGSIEVGKMADFTIMSGDLLTAEGDELEAIEPVMTIVGGAQAWPRPEKKLPVFGQ